MLASAKLLSSPWRSYLAKVCFSSNITPVSLAYNVFESSGTDTSAPPLIIMHGLMGSMKNWRGMGRALESKLKRRVFTVDARNHGDSPHTSTHGSAEMAADLIEFMRSQSITKASVMGHSMGGRTMMFLALKYPEVVDRAIIVDISPLKIPRDFSSMDQIFEAMKSISVPPSLSMAQGRAIVEGQLKDAVDAQATVDFIMLNLRKRDTGEFYWAPNVEGLQQNLRHFGNFLSHFSNGETCQTPTMFLCGNQSNFVDPDSFPEIQKLFPVSEIHWLDAGHLVHFDQPAQFLDLSVKFLKD